MQKRLKIALIALCCSSFGFAQNTQTTTNTDEQAAVSTDESAFTFTEAQLGEDDNYSQEATVIGSNGNIYASEIGYKWSPVRFRYRAFNQKYNDVYINGNPVKDAESNQFRYSLVGGLNNYTRSAEFSLPFEDNSFSMTAMGGSNNYNFRPSAMATGHRASLTGANRNYTIRGMYSYNSGVTEKGWAFSAGLTYRWANMETSNIEGTFYNALSYFLGVEKIINDHHTLSLVTWGNPTERAAQGSSTDEMYWIANNNFYNPYWGYQEGKKRNSRIVHDFAPSALLTWDWTIDEKTKLTTTLFGKYAMYSSSKLDYNNSTNPAPDYYKSMPSSYYDVWDPYDASNTDQALADWWSAYNHLKASKENRQINWDRLYFANKTAAAQGADAMYIQKAYHNDQFTLSLASNLKKQLTINSTLNAGLSLSTNTGYHYQKLVDALGGKWHNVNNFVVGTYAEGSQQTMYDIRDGGKEVKEGDRFGYDYNILVNKANVWASYAENFGPLHYSISARVGGTTMQRNGKMQNGLAPTNSLGKSRTAKFLDGGLKFGSTLNAGAGHFITFGISYEQMAPAAKNSFISPEINNDFVFDLKNEDVYSLELGYHYKGSWVSANLNAFYSQIFNSTEYSMYYFDDDTNAETGASNSAFTYVSLTDISKQYYGVELGLNFKITSWMNIKAMGTISDAKYSDNSNVVYMNSNTGAYTKDVVLNDGMRESGTPLTAGCLDLNMRYKGWFVDVIGNYYDRIYLSYTPVTRYKSYLEQTPNGEYIVPEQAKGKGGFMLDASIGKSIYLKKGMLSFNLMVSNILNNIKICTGGYEQSRRDPKNKSGETTRIYSFQNNPKKFYANGTNGMLIITYKF